MTNENVNNISEKDRAYFAGFFDGEGCVYVKKAIPTGKGANYTLGISFGVTYAPILYEMKKLFGGNVRSANMEKVRNCQSIKSKTGATPENWKQSYIFYLHSKEAWIFLKIIEPFCREKKEQIRVGIEFFQGYRGGKGYGLSKSQIERCEYYYKKLREMKKFSDKIDNDLLEFEDSQQTFCTYLER